MPTVLSNFPSPEPDESFGSYLWRAAQAAEISPHALLRRSGAVTQTRPTMPNLLTRTLHVLLSREQILQVAAFFGLTPGRVSRMLLTRYEGTLYDPAAISTRRFIPMNESFQREWIELTEMRFCPHCLAETGAWQLPWHLAYAVVCTRHGVLLNRICLNCEQPTCAGAVTAHARETLDLIPDSRRCQNTYPVPGRTCNSDLSAQRAIPVVQGGPLMEAQRALDRMLDGGFEELHFAGLDPDGFFRDLRQLCQVMLAAAPRDLALGPLPESVALAFRAFKDARDERFRWWQRHASRVTQQGLLGSQLWTPPPDDPAVLAAVLPTALNLLLVQGAPERAAFVRSALSGHPLWLNVQGKLQWSAAF